jgi:glucuronate isomerase
MNNNFPKDRYFNPDHKQKMAAQSLYESVVELPLVCPHGHVEPSIFSDPDYSFGTPTELLIIPDHYAVRMLYSQGIPMENLGIPRLDKGPVESDHRKIWQTFADNFYLFRGTPTGLWINHELKDIFGIEEKLNTASAQPIYDQVSEKLSSPEFCPRALYERFNIEVLCTTESATDTLEHHLAIRSSGWPGRIVPAFRPDALVHLDTPDWIKNIQTLSEVSGIEVDSYKTFIQALEKRRSFFKSLGATSTDHAVLKPYTEPLSLSEAEEIFQRALKGDIDFRDVIAFDGHMLMEMARMSIEDGLVMQLHPGSYRNYDEAIYTRFGLDKGADIPIQTEYTHNLLPLLDKYGNDNRLSLILFTLDESTYTRELAPLAGVYPTVKLGPPWWFHDSLNGIARFFDQVIETAGIYNTAGFNDDTRAFCSIPARHDVWRRASANWLAGLVARHIIDMNDAQEMMVELAVGLAKRAYHL